MIWKRILVILALILISCNPKPQTTAVINIKGSDTMLKLTENLANEFMKINPGISIYVSGGGTSVGVRALIRGEVDITTASRNLSSNSYRGPPTTNINRNARIDFHKLICKIFS